ncbi:hypothetical protein niasHT_004181 [Heterodera trifolii]|uniref:Uncharacterized protein n=1 Tax=Heterodera trifolii TaxID=157864 RepID=A0ABD2ME10_9BILA
MFEKKDKRFKDMETTNRETVAKAAECRDKALLSLTEAKLSHTKAELSQTKAGFRQKEEENDLLKRQVGGTKNVWTVPSPVFLLSVLPSSIPSAHQHISVSGSNGAQEGTTQKRGAGSRTAAGSTAQTQKAKEQRQTQQPQKPREVEQQQTPQTQQQPMDEQQQQAAQSQQQPQKSKYVPPSMRK